MNLTIFTGSKVPRPGTPQDKREHFEDGMNEHKVELATKGEPGAWITRTAGNGAGSRVFVPMHNVVAVCYPPPPARAEATSAAATTPTTAA